MFMMLKLMVLCLHCRQSTTRTKAGALSASCFVCTAGMRVLAEASCTLLKQLMLAVPLPVLELLLCKTPPAALLNLPEFDRSIPHRVACMRSERGSRAWSGRGVEGRAVLGKGFMGRHRLFAVEGMLDVCIHLCNKQSQPVDCSVNMQSRDQFGCRHCGS